MSDITTQLSAIAKSLQVAISRQEEVFDWTQTWGNLSHTPLKELPKFMYEMVDNQIRESLEERERELERLQRKIDRQRSEWLANGERLTPYDLEQSKYPGLMDPHGA